MYFIQLNIHLNNKKYIYIFRDYIFTNYINKKKS